MPGENVFECVGGPLDGYEFRGEPSSVVTLPADQLRIDQDPTYRAEPEGPVAIYVLRDGEYHFDGYRGGEKPR